MTARRWHPVLVLLAAASGCAALIYEIVWLQALELSIGSTAVSLAVLLGTFMGGMCLGSLALPHFLSPRWHPLRVYALLELGLGICGISILFGAPYVDRVYSSVALPGFAGILLRGAVCALCLLPPTLLMGASLPAIARWVETTPQGVSWLGLFYGGNIAGAVFGCLLAGFYLLRVHDMATATWVAAGINVAVATAAFGLAALLPRGETAPAEGLRHGGSRTVLVAIALSGLCALGAEVIWTRLLSLMLGATVYTFSVILAVFLLGLGLGSSAGSYLSRRVRSPRLGLAVCQLLQAAAIAWAAYLVARRLPYWRQSDLVRCLGALLPAACLWGASFPLALAAAAKPGQDPGWLVGRVYAANTTGAIVGAVAFSLVLIPGIGTQQAQRVLIGLSVAAAAVLLRKKDLPYVAAATLLAWTVPQIPWGVVAWGRQLPTRSIPGDLLYLGEGRNASIAITEAYKTRMFHVSGKVEASNQEQDMRLERMLGHLPAVLHPQPRSVLVVGCGAGVTAGAFVPHPEVGRIVICEIEPLIAPAVARYFARENHDVLRDRRTEIVYDDARHYILTGRDRFDIVTSDPIHPWVKGSATLYTREYFELCKRRLKPGGMVTQWVPLYESNLETVKSEIATFFEVFPNGTVWGNDTLFGEGYDVVLLGQVDAPRIDLDAVERRIEGPVAQSLREVGFRSAVGLLATYAGRARDLERWLDHAQINRDRNLRLQYLAGMGLNSRGAEIIYEQMLHYRRFPEELFAGERREALRRALR